MTKRLRIGYVPLTDAALLHVVKAQNLTARYGLDLELVAESSWANIRDKLVAGHFDAAHMLAPAAIAVSLGIGQIEAPLMVPVALGLNGNAITVSQALFEALLQEAQGDMSDPRVTVRALARIVARRRERADPPVTFGHVFPFSSHHYQLRLWLQAGHIDPDEDVRLVVVPPPFMAETLRKGQLDGFCVGAPWNSVAAAAGAGVILHQGTDIVRDCPEKVLAFRTDWAHSHKEEVSALVQAIGDASRWAASPRNRSSLVTLLMTTAGQDVAAPTIERNPRRSGLPFWFPPRRHRVAARRRRDQRQPGPGALALCPDGSCWSDRLFGQLLPTLRRPSMSRLLGPPIPGPAATPAVFDAPAFSANDIPSYLAALKARRPSQ